MAKRLLIAAAVLLVIVVAVVLLARAAFASDAARVDLLQQLSTALGQRASAASITVSPLWPTITVHDVAVGDDGAIHIGAVRIRPGISVLLSRRIDNPDVTISGMHVTLPLQQPLAVSGGEGPLALAHMRSLTISDLQLSTHGRRLRINGGLRPHDGPALTVTSATIDGDDMHAALSGEISDITLWKGELHARGDALDGDVLRSLAWDLLDRPEGDRSSAPPTAASGNAPLIVDLEVARLTLGPIAASGVTGKAAIGPGAAILDPVSFSAFGGRYKGQIALRFEGGVPSVRWYGDLSNISLAGLTSAATGPPAISGALTGDVDLTGSGVDFVKALTSVRGSARVRLTDGRIANLGLLRSILAASSPNPQQTAQQSSGPGDTPFKLFSTSLSMSGGSASLLDMRLEGDDLTMVGGGGLRLDGSAVTVFADVQLSEAMSKQLADSRGRPLERGARLTVPVTIRGGTSHYQISVDVQEMTSAPLAEQTR